MLAHFIDSKTFQCGYFDDRNSFFEEYLLEDVSEAEFEFLLSNGMRHFGDYYFRPRCNGCYDCIPIRLKPDAFIMSRSQKRALKKCSNVKIKIGPPRFSEKKFELYLEHKERFPSLQDDVEDIDNFSVSFYESVPFGIEFEYYYKGELVGAALGDFTRNTFSAVYTFYVNPEPQMSLGVFSVLKQLQFAKECGIKFFYLGYFILQNPSLNYKANFKPNEVFINNEWVAYHSEKGNTLVSNDALYWKNTEFLVKETQSEEFRGDLRIR